MFSFKRALPDDMGISSRSIKRILERLEKKSVPMHSLLIMKDDHLIFEKYYAPYDENTLHRMFSISKSFTAIAISLLIKDKKISYNDRIVTFFPEYVSEDTHPWIKEMTIRDMLMMRTCHASTTYKVDMKSDWVESFFTVPPTHKSGTVFHYDTSSAHVLCALVEKLSGKDMLTFLKDNLLMYVDFSEVSYMVKDPFGVSIGGSGLMATPMDIMKVLYILEHKGTIVCSDGKERSLLSEDFISDATSNLSDTFITAPLPSESQGYGMQIWQNEKGGFVLYGMGGQLAISIPSEKLLVVTTADTQGMQGGNQIIYDALYDNLLCDQQPLNAADNAELITYADALMISPPRLPESYNLTEPSRNPYTIPDFIKKIAGCKTQSHLTLNYRLSPNTHNFTSLTLQLNTDGNCCIALTQTDTLHRIFFGLGMMGEGSFPIYGIPYIAGAMWCRDNVLYIKAHLVGECVGSVHFELFFEENELTVYMRKIEETYFKEFDGHLHGFYSSASQRL